MMSGSLCLYFAIPRPVEYDVLTCRLTLSILQSAVCQQAIHRDQLAASLLLAACERLASSFIRVLGSTGLTM